MINGKRISGRYKIIDMIGGGGMANVYLAHDMILDRDVALKMLRLDFANDDEFIRRFHREAQSATSLAHPNIVSIYDVGEEDGLYYIVMEYVDGQTLKQYIQQNAPLRVDEAIEIMKQLTSAISHAHQNHIVHRDIKPHNILIDRKGNVKITDFGIAMALSATSITQTNSVLGSVHYLSPEQARGGTANKKSDIYSLGIVFFEMLTGRLPFSGESAVSIALKHLQSDTPSPKRWNPSIPQSVENIVLKATAKDPFHRYNNVEEMEDDLITGLNPERINELKFVIPVDDEATKAIPVITNDRPFKNLDETIVAKGNQLQDDSKKLPKKRKKWPIVMASTFLIIVLLGIFIVFFLPSFLAPDIVEVPDVSSQSLRDAKEDLEAAGFKIGEEHELTDDEIQEGFVIKTNPKAGRKEKQGTTIDLYLSSGKKTFKLSNYVDRQYDVVVQLLDNKNFKDIEKNDVFDSSEPGTILEQYPDPEEEVIPEDTVIKFTVSKGPEMIKLKDLRGFNQTNVEEYGKSTGLIIDMSKTEFHETFLEGTVIKQSPDPDTELKKGDTVTVILSKGKEKIPPKTVKKQVYIQYEPAVEGTPQEISVYIEDANRSMTTPWDTFSITGPRELTIELLILYGKKAGYKIFRDGVIIEEEEVDYPDE
ncbi:Stk1 family PASTA domain-containing Ser/Thr kinase [Bacillus sp. CGMCC 1.16607]|uniref:Stk1 family PASTA domain-containing Ser/Thr kinase n=1 Tax=Bacillus sp. CGMCC 1.16607 TaxID=3351842 RepID=UPI003635AEC7